VRKFLSILLLALFALPVVSPLFALGTDADAGVPVCCRRNGKHHCFMTDPVGSAPSEARFGVRGERCPYSPAAIGTVHQNQLTAAGLVVDLVTLASHPAGVVQIESRRRIARDRSRQKRGPPAFLLS
jgi:hypothetical protein